MNIEDLRNLKNSRKWYQLCKGIIKMVNKDNIQEIHDIYIGSISQYHPLTVTECTLVISKLLPTKEAKALVDKSIDTIKECNMYHGDFSIQIVHLEIQRNLLKIDCGDMEGIEKKLYELKQMDLPSNVYELYNFLGFRYFEKMGNVDYCIKYLVLYIEMSGDETYYESLAKYTLVSQGFFNFIKIASLRNFSKIDSRLLDIYETVQNGDTKKIHELQDELKGQFGDTHQTIVEKTYFIGLINMCFKEKSRQIGLDKLQAGLGLGVNEIHPFILRAFGLGLLKGWVDEVNNTLFFSTILPRTLPKEELIKMKDKFSVWKKKVGETISMIK